MLLLSVFLYDEIIVNFILQLYHFYELKSLQVILLMFVGFPTHKTVSWATANNVMSRALDLMKNSYFFCANLEFPLQF